MCTFISLPGTFVPSGFHIAAKETIIFGYLSSHNNTTTFRCNKQENDNTCTNQQLKAIRSAEKLFF